MKKLLILALLSPLFFYSCTKEDPINEDPDPTETVYTDDPPTIVLNIQSSATLISQEENDYNVEVPRNQDLSLEYVIQTPGGFSSANLDGDPLNEVGDFTLNSDKTEGKFQVTFIYLSGGLPPAVLEVTDQNGKTVSASVKVSLPLGFDPDSALPGDWETTNFEASDKNGFVNQVIGTSNGSLLLSNDDQIFRSIDKGESWNQVNISISGFLGDMIQVPNGDIYVSSYEPGTIWVSSDDGLNWNKAETNLPTFSGISKFHVSESGHIYASLFLNEQNSTVDGVYKSADGVSWERVADVRNIEGIQSYGENEVYAFTAFPASLVWSSDQGATWESFNIPSAEFVVGFIKTEAGMIMTTDRDVYQSTDAGETWSTFNQGIPDNDFVKNLTVSNTGAIIATPTNYGVFQLDSENTWRSIGTGLGTINIRSLTYLDDQLFASGFATQRIYMLK